MKSVYTDKGRLVKYRQMFDLIEIIADYKKRRELLIQKETVCVYSFIQTA